MTGTTVDFDTQIGTESLAKQIGHRGFEWSMARDKAMNEAQEVRNYVLATDTKTLPEGKSTPWRNKTVVPKITQIRDNLQVNYMDALFPHDSWMQWQGDDADSASKQKADFVEGFLQNKLEKSKFKVEAEKLVQDYIDYGNAFARVKFVSESYKDQATGEEVKGFQGAKMFRISPNDIVFNPLSPEFRKAPKIIRELVSYGELVRWEKNETDPKKKQGIKDALDKAGTFRVKSQHIDFSDNKLDERLRFDGFGNLIDYLNSGMVEILSFYGDFFDATTGELKEKRHIKIIDRSFVLFDEPIKSWNGSDGIHHVGWRGRQDSLYAMGPLANLIGMQYRINHLENLRADIFDAIAFPPLKIFGDADPNFSWQPGTKILLGEGDDVQMLTPDTTALRADFQIQRYEQLMEEMAGAPKEAMGFRTAGEKTAFEVDKITTAAARVFINKTRRFEEQIIEPVLLDMLEISRRNLGDDEVIRTTTQDRLQIFKTITKEDITANGKLKAKGATFFARQAQLAQNLTNLNTIADPEVRQHLSSKKTAEMYEELTQLDGSNLYKPFVRLEEQQEGEQLLQGMAEETALQEITQREEGI